jgi:hypothetical protein
MAQLARRRRIRRQCQNRNADFNKIGQVARGRTVLVTHTIRARDPCCRSLVRFFSADKPQHLQLLERQQKRTNFGKMWDSNWNRERKPQRYTSHKRSKNILIYWISYDICTRLWWINKIKSLTGEPNDTNKESNRDISVHSNLDITFLWGAYNFVIIFWNQQSYIREFLYTWESIG